MDLEAWKWKSKIELRNLAMLSLLELSQGALWPRMVPRVTKTGMDLILTITEPLV